MDNRTAISLALQKACKYIQAHEDISNYSKQTHGKILYHELLALVAMLSRGEKATDEAHSLSGGSVEADQGDRLKHWKKELAELCAEYKNGYYDRFDAKKKIVLANIMALESARLPYSPVGTPTDKKEGEA